MGSKGKTRKLFPGGNTAKGFYSFFQYILGDNYTKRFILKGGPGVGKSTFMRGIGDYMLEHGFDVEEYHCPTDPDSLDAISIPKIGVALLDGTAPHIIEPQNPGITDDIVWLGDFWDGARLLESKDEIIKLRKKASKLFEIAFSHLKEAGIAYDEWKSYVYDDFNEKNYNLAVRQVIEQIFENRENGDHKQVRHTHFFASAISGKGVYNYTENLIEPYHRIYAFSGMPGSGSNRAIGRIAKEAEELGFSTQQYHCPLSVDELDMLIIPELDSVVVHIDQILSGEKMFFDCNRIEAYVYFDDYLSHETINEFAHDIEQAKKRIYSLVERAIDLISRAKAVHGEIEEYYVEVMDFEGVDIKRREILEEIIKLTCCSS